MPILNSINQMQEEMKDWRQDLHRIPEIGLKEYKTSEFIQNKLRSWNIDFKTGYANTGIVAWIKGNGGSSNKSIGLREPFIFRTSYILNSVFTSANILTARSRSVCVWAAEIWARILAVPLGTMG